jgi:hypothetical protein
MNLFIAIAVCLIILVLLNLFAMKVLASSQVYDKDQKRLQRRAIWGLPFFGSILVIGVVRSDRANQKISSEVGNLTAMTDEDAIVIRDAADNVSRIDD